MSSLTLEERAQRKADWEKFLFYTKIQDIDLDLVMSFFFRSVNWPNCAVGVLAPAHVVGACEKYSDYVQWPKPEPPPFYYLGGNFAVALGELEQSIRNRLPNVFKKKILEQARAFWRQIETRVEETEQS